MRESYVDGLFDRSFLQLRQSLAYEIGMLVTGALLLNLGNGRMLLNDLGNLAQLGDTQ